MISENEELKGSKQRRFEVIFPYSYPPETLNSVQIQISTQIPPWGKEEMDLGSQSQSDSDVNLERMLI